LTARHIIQGDTFQGDAITSLASTLDDVKGNSYPGALRSAAIIRLRALEKSMAEGGSPQLDEEQRKLDASIRMSLARAPADPFLWVVLFWLENARNGFSRNHLKLLQESYALGPNEGWVAIRRNRLALAIFSQLSPNLRREVVREFAGLVRSHYIAQAADLLVGPGWPVRDQLLSGLRDVPQLPREQLAKAVYDLGYDVSVPGVTLPAPRPWRR
ncbi:MAG: hypothetical protein WCC36_18860, partial [Gammaproteobacteria bacterium]